MSAPDLRAQLEAVRAQAMAIVATVDALIGNPEERCCNEPAPKTVETYSTRTTYCQNCKTILNKVSLEPSEPKGGENNA